jgi:hypothetical protein
MALVVPVPVPRLFLPELFLADGETEFLSREAHGLRCRVEREKPRRRAGRGSCARALADGKARSAAQASASVIPSVTGATVRGYRARA